MRTLIGCSFSFEFKMCEYIVIFAIDPTANDPVRMSQKNIFFGVGNKRRKNLSSEKLGSLPKKLIRSVFVKFDILR